MIDKLEKCLFGAETPLFGVDKGSLFLYDTYHRGVISSYYF